MKNLLLFVFIPVILFSSNILNAQQNHAFDCLIRNITIIDAAADEPQLAGMDVFIKKDKIVKIAPTGEKPQDAARIIDGTGKYLSPGLADMHAHVHNTNSQRYFLLNIAAGVTTLRSMRGDSAHLTMRKKIETGEWDGPNLFLSPDPFVPKTTIKKEELPAVISGYKKQGYDFIKILGIPDSAYYETVMKASNDASLMVAGHLPRPVSLDRTIETGYSCIEHLHGYIGPFEDNTEKFKQLLEKTKAKNMYNCPTMDYYTIYYPYPETDKLMKRNGVKFMDTGAINEWHREVGEMFAERDTMNQDSLKKEDEENRTYLMSRLKVLKEMSNAGCMLLVSPATEGMYSVPGFAMYEELDVYQKALIINQRILKAATYNAACYFKQEKTWGRIAEGQRADLIITDKNPLDNIKNVYYPQVVFVRGKYYNAVELREKLLVK